MPSLLRPATTEKIAIVLLPERPRDAVEGNRVDAGVYESQAKADDSHRVPEFVVLNRGEWIKVEP